MVSINITKFRIDFNVVHVKFLMPKFYLLSMAIFHVSLMNSPKLQKLAWLRVTSKRE